MLTAPKLPAVAQGADLGYGRGFVILLPTVGVLCLYKGKDTTWTGWELIGFGLVDGVFAWFQRADRPWGLDK